MARFTTWAVLKRLLFILGVALSLVACDALLEAEEEEAEGELSAEEQARQFINANSKKKVVLQGTLDLSAFEEEGGVDLTATEDGSFNLQCSTWEETPQICDVAIKDGSFKKGCNFVAMPFGCTLRFGDETIADLDFDKGTARKAGPFFFDINYDPVSGEFKATVDEEKSSPEFELKGFETATPELTGSWSIKCVEKKKLGFQCPKDGPDGEKIYLVQSEEKKEHKVEIWESENARNQCKNAKGSSLYPSITIGGEAVDASSNEAVANKVYSALNAKSSDAVSKLWDIILDRNHEEARFCENIIEDAAQYQYSTDMCMFYTPPTDTHYFTNESGESIVEESEVHLGNFGEIEGKFPSYNADGSEVWITDSASPNYAVTGSVSGRKFNGKEVYIACANPEEYRQNPSLSSLWIERQEPTPADSLEEAVKQLNGAETSECRSELEKVDGYGKTGVPKKAKRDFERALVNLINFGERDREGMCGHEQTVAANFDFRKCNNWNENGPTPPVCHTFFQLQNSFGIHVNSTSGEFEIDTVLLDHIPDSFDELVEIGDEIEADEIAETFDDVVLPDSCDSGDDYDAGECDMWLEDFNKQYFEDLEEDHGFEEGKRFEVFFDRGLAEDICPNTVAELESVDWGMYEDMHGQERHFIAPCQDEFLAATNKVELLQNVAMRWQPVESQLFCNNNTFASAIAGIQQDSCLPELEISHVCDDSGHCKEQVFCRGTEDGSCLDDDGKFQGRVKGRHALMDLELGIGGHIRMESEESSRVRRYNPETGTEEYCKFSEAITIEGVVLKKNKFVAKFTQSSNDECDSGDDRRPGAGAGGNQRGDDRGGDRGGDDRGGDEGGGAFSQFLEFNKKKK